MSIVSGCITSRRFAPSRGVVLESGTQKPVADATVLASYTKGGLVLLGVTDGCRTYHVTKTDTDGRFTVPPTTGWNIFIPPLLAVGVGRSELAVYKDGYEASRAVSHSEKDEVLILLTRADTSGGREWRSFGFCPQTKFIP